MNPPSIRRIALPAFGSLLLALSSGGNAQEPAPPGARPTVVELFTSQGCSSCPPADELLGELAGRSNVIALGFHVDYWDDIGWRDRYSMAEATRRQRDYVDALGLSSAFTPQIVIDGRESFVGSDRHRIEAALSRPREHVPVEVHIANGEMIVSLSELNDHRSYDIEAAAYLPRATTPIGRGENSGRTLTDFDIVRQFRRLGVWEGKSATFRIRLDTFPGEADRVAVLVQQSGHGPIVGAASASLR
jgi:hypothetical protein